MEEMQPEIEKKSPPWWKILLGLGIGLLAIVLAAFIFGMKKVADMYRNAEAVTTLAPTVVPTTNTFPELAGYPWGDIYFLDYDKTATNTSSLNRDIFVFNEATGTVKQLTNSHSFLDLDKGFDDKTLTTVNAGDVWIASTSGKLLRQVTRSGGKINQAKISPDRKAIAFSEFTSGQINTPDSLHTTKVVPVAGGTAKRIWPPNNVIEAKEYGSGMQIEDTSVSPGSSLSRWVNSDMIELMGCVPFACDYTWWVNVSSGSATRAANDDISAVAAHLTPDQKYISVMGDGNLTIYDVNLHEVYKTPFSQYGSDIMTADKKYLIAADTAFHIKVVDVLNQKETSFTLPKPSTDSRELLFENAPNGNLYYFVEKSLVRLNLGTGKVETVMEKFPGTESAFLGSPVWIVNK